MKALVLQSPIWHYEVLGVFLQWRLQSAAWRGELEELTLAIPLDDAPAYDWLEFYKGLGLLVDDCKKLKIISSDSLVHTDLERCYDVVMFPTDDNERFLSLSTPALRAKSVCLWHLPSPLNPKAHDCASTIGIRGGDAWGRLPVMVPVHQGPSPDDIRVLRRAATSGRSGGAYHHSLCILGKWTVCSFLRTAAASGVSLRFIVRDVEPDRGRVSDLPMAHNHLEILSGSLSQIVGHLLQANGAIVSKRANFASTRVSGTIGTCVSLLVPMLLPIEMKSVFPSGLFPASGVLLYDRDADDDSAVMELVAQLAQVDLDKYALERDALVAHNMGVLDAAVSAAMIAPTTRTAPPPPPSSVEKLSRELHCVYLHPSHPLFRGIPDMLLDNVRQWGTSLNAAVRVWNTLDFLRLAPELGRMQAAAGLRAAQLLVAKSHVGALCFSPWSRPRTATQFLLSLLSGGDSGSVALHDLHNVETLEASDGGHIDFILITSSGVGGVPSSLPGARRYVERDTRALQRHQMQATIVVPWALSDARGAFDTRAWWATCLPEGHVYTMKRPCPLLICALCVLVAGIVLLAGWMH